MEKSQKAEVIIKSPGRINLIGEHIDYNGGFVMPAAIDKVITFSLDRNEGRECTIFSENYKNEFSFSLDKVEVSEVEWQNYILGVVHFIEKLRPGKLSGFTCKIHSNLPVGAGISSSAALECGLAKGLNSMFELGLTDLEIINIGRDAEHNYVGTKCGIMDQFAVVMGKKGKLIKLNSDTLDYDYVPADFGKYNLLLLNTNISHNLSGSEYNTRRKECDAAMEVIQGKYPQYKYLANVPLEVLEELKGEFKGKEYDRALYAAMENQRVKLAAEALNDELLQVFGDCLYESHKGLKELYEVSCKELDFLVDYSRKFESVIGARMMGGGFGGCTINLVNKDKIDSYIREVSKAYKEEFGIELTPIKVAISNGVTRI